MRTLSLKQKLIYIFLGFLGLVLLRLVYGYMAYPQVRNTGYAYMNQNRTQSSFSLVRRNYASKKMLYSKEGKAINKARGVRSAQGGVDQKYEKIGTLASSTKAYDKDIKVLYGLIKSEKLMIQFEKSSGLKLARKLDLALGVIPDKFDDIIGRLKKIGRLKRITIDKKDKTNEYKNLEAKRISLEKARKTLLELNQVKGDVGDKIGLVNRLLEIENKIQSLGVSLGEFDSQNEFCTVKFTLWERRTPQVISFGHRISVALWWAAQVYFYLWIIIILGLLALLLAIKVFDAGYKSLTTVEKDAKKG